jgi:hypothetical protein
MIISGEKELENADYTETTKHTKDSDERQRIQTPTAQDGTQETEI